MLCRLPLDVIQYMASYLLFRERCILRSVCREFARFSAKGHVLYDYTERNMMIMYTQTWSFRNRNPQMGLQCRVCGICFRTPYDLFSHLETNNHYYPLYHLCFHWNGLNFHVRNVEDSYCVHHRCECPSKRWDLHSLMHALKGSSKCVTVFTKGSTIRIGLKVFCGIMDVQRNARYYSFPYIYLNFLNVFFHTGHLWVSYYHPYDEMVSYSRLFIPIYDIRIEEIDYTKT